MNDQGRGLLRLVAEPDKPVGTVRVYWAQHGRGKTRSAVERKRFHVDCNALRRSTVRRALRRLGSG